MPNLSVNKKVTKKNLHKVLDTDGVQLSRMGNAKNITPTALEELVLMYARGEVKLLVDSQKRITARPKDYIAKRGRPRKNPEPETIGSIETEAVEAAA